MFGHVVCESCLIQGVSKLSSTICLFEQVHVQDREESCRNAAGLTNCLCR